MTFFVTQEVPFNLCLHVMIFFLQTSSLSSSSVIKIFVIEVNGFFFWVHDDSIMKMSEWKLLALKNYVYANQINIGNTWPNSYSYCSTEHESRITKPVLLVIYSIRKENGGENVEIKIQPTVWETIFSTLRKPIRYNSDQLWPASNLW